MLQKTLQMHVVLLDYTPITGQITQYKVEGDITMTEKIFEFETTKFSYDSPLCEM